jgi:hypothetical protein
MFNKSKLIKAHNSSQALGITRKEGEASVQLPTSAPLTADVMMNITTTRSLHSEIGIATGYGLNDRGVESQ